MFVITGPKTMITTLNEEHGCQDSTPIYEQLLEVSGLIPIAVVVLFKAKILLKLRAAKTAWRATSDGEKQKQVTIL